jgi:hypothetical protein
MEVSREEARYFAESYYGIEYPQRRTWTSREISVAAPIPRELP